MTDVDERHHGAADEPLREVLKTRLLRLDTLRFETKLLIGAVLANLFVAAILVFIRNGHLSSVQSDAFADTTATLPIVVLAASVLFTSVAWGLILAGAFRGGWVARVVGLGFFVWAQWSVREVLDGVSGTTSAVVYLLLGLIIVIGVVTWFPERRGRERSEPDAPPDARWTPARNLLPLVLMLLVGGIYATAWLGNRAAGQTYNFTDDVAFQISNISYMLIPLLVLAGSHFGDWGSFISNRITERISGSVPQWVLPTVAVVVAGAILWDGVRISASDGGGGVGTELLLGGVVVVVVVGLFFLAKPRGDWPGHFPFLVIAAVAIADSTAGYIAERQFGVADKLRYAKVDSVTAMFFLVLGAIAIIVLLVRRKKLSGVWVAACSFLVVIGLTDILSAVGQAGILVHPFGLHSSGTTDHLDTNAPYMGVEALKMWGAIATIALTSFALVTRRLSRLKVPIRALLTLTVSLQILQWVDSLFGKTITATEREALIAGLVLIVALTWEIAASGEGITNATSRLFPRDARVLLYIGYILLVAAAALFYSSLHDPRTGHLLESQFDAEQWVRDGVLFLGVPLVITIFLLAMQRWRASLRAGPETASETDELPSGEVGTSAPA